jgi:hypothetical protein
VNHDPLLPAVTNEIFAHYIVHAMPVGIRGLIIAGVFATMMGSTSAALNALATSFIRDFYQPYINPAEALKQAQGRLQMIGLNFDISRDFCSTMEEDTSAGILPLVRFGGALGADGSVYGYTKDDGISPMLGHGLALRVETQRLPSGLVQVAAMIVPN